MGKRDVKDIRTGSNSHYETEYYIFGENGRKIHQDEKLNQGTNYRKVGLTKITGDEILICGILPIKVFKKESIGMNEQPVHLETKCHEDSGRGETADVSWVSESY
jgi:hypothetical protein